MLRWLATSSAIACGERYGRNLSQLVNDLMDALPLDDPAPAELSPLVRRLLGVAVTSQTDSVP